MFKTTRNTPEYTWLFLGETVRGRSHEKKNLPNQDAKLIIPESGSKGTRGLCVISDGHGASIHFRSDMGSQKAVEAASAAYFTLMRQQKAQGMALPAIRQHLEFNLPGEIYKRWRWEIAQLLLEKPFEKEELAALKDNVTNANEQNRLMLDPVVAFGATVCMVVVEQEYLFCLQLGDGEILFVSDDGQVTVPLATTETLIANETHSLCMPDAPHRFRTAFKTISGREAPALIMLTTDGYVNAFKYKNDFYKVGSDLLNMAREDFSQVQEHLRGWLFEATHDYSGDDITVAIICRTDVMNQAKPADTRAAAEEPAAPDKTQTDTPPTEGTPS